MNMSARGDWRALSPGRLKPARITASGIQSHGDAPFSPISPDGADHLERETERAQPFHHCGRGGPT